MLENAVVNLIREYQNSADSNDEILDQKGNIKPHWETLFNNLD